MGYGYFRLDLFLLWRKLKAAEPPLFLRGRAASALRRVTPLWSPLMQPLDPGDDGPSLWEGSRFARGSDIVFIQRPRISCLGDQHQLHYTPHPRPLSDRHSSSMTAESPGTRATMPFLSLSWPPMTYVPTQLMRHSFASAQWGRPGRWSNKTPQLQDPCWERRRTKGALTDSPGFSCRAVKLREGIGARVVNSLDPSRVIISFLSC